MQGATAFQPLGLLESALLVTICNQIGVTLLYHLVGLTQGYLNATAISAAVSNIHTRASRRT